MYILRLSTTNLSDSLFNGKLKMVIKMMGIKNAIDKKQIEMPSLDQLVPENHIIRKIEQAIKLEFIYDMV